MEKWTFLCVCVWGGGGEGEGGGGRVVQRYHVP